MSDTKRSRFTRDYGPVLEAVRELPADASRGQRMRAVCDAIWEHMGGEGPGREISWIGFYGIGEERSEMVLLERRDKPACSPIGLHGACGRAWRERRTIIVDDVRSLGEDYIACDPRDMSELVIPCFDADGSCWGVLDADSFEVGAFDGRDAAAMAELLGVTTLSTARQADIVCL